MAIVNMKKVVLAGPHYRRDDVLSLLQSKGTVQLVDLKENPHEIKGVEYYRESANISEVKENYDKVKFVYSFLKQYNSDKKSLFVKRDVISMDEFEQLESKVDWQSLYERAIELEENIKSNRNRAAKAEALMEQYSDWNGLDISGSDVNGLKKVSYYTGSILKRTETGLYEELNSSFNDIYIEKISDKKLDTNLFILCHNDDAPALSDILKKYGFTRVNLDLEVTPKNRINELISEIELFNQEFNELTQNARDLSENLKDIEMIYDYYSNRLEKENAVSNLVKTEKTFMLEGWIAEDSIKEIEGLLEESCEDIYFSFEDYQEDEEPPIILKNNAFVEPFEAITSMYALPQPTEVDPTPVLTPFYLIFFGMMAGDIGYGLVLLLATGAALRFMDLEGESRKLVKLLLYVSVPTIFFGWVFGGFFGNAIPVKPLWINPVDNPMDVLYVSIALGLAHLFTGLGVKAYWFIKNGRIMDAVYDVLFWYLLITGLLWVLLSGTIGGGTIAKYVAITGALGLLLTQGRANKSLAGKIFGGIYGLYGVTSYIGDLLSYSRLLALGLATSLIGSSFNLLIQLLGGGIVAIIAGPIIFIAGHTFNLLIGMLGTFVHTCRLEYLEFFGKFYEGGGKPFIPLKITTKFIKVDTQK